MRSPAGSPVISAGEPAAGYRGSGDAAQDVDAGNDGLSRGAICYLARMPGPRRWAKMYSDSALLDFGRYTSYWVPNPDLRRKQRNSGFLIWAALMT